jgi:uncharacterized repeat protein (TIGR01451 family)
VERDAGGGARRGTGHGFGRSAASAGPVFGRGAGRGTRSSTRRGGPGKPEHDGLGVVVGSPSRSASSVEVVKDSVPATYTVTDANRGPDVAHNVTVTDQLNPALTVTSVPRDRILDASTMTCLINTLAVGETNTFTVTAKVAANTRPGTEIHNYAVATSSLTKVPLAVPPSCVQTAILAPPSAHLVITKTGPGRCGPVARSSTR